MQRGAVSETEELGRVVQAAGCGGPGSSRALRRFLSALSAGDDGCNPSEEPALSLTSACSRLWRPLPWAGAAPPGKRGCRGVRLRLGRELGGHWKPSRIAGSSFSLCLVSGESMRVLFPSIFCFLQPCWQPHRFPNQLRGLRLLTLDPGLAWPICLSNCPLPRRESPSLCNPLPLLCPLVKMQVQPNCISSLPTWFCVCVFRALVIKSLFASLQFVFSEHCSTYRYIFDVFVGAGELCVLLVSRFIFISVLVF